MLADQIDLEGPRGVGVAEREREIRDARQHEALVDQGFVCVLDLTVDGNLDTAEQLKLEPGGGDDDVGLQFAAGLEQNAGLGEPHDLVGDHRGLALGDGAEQIGVGHCAEPLIPRVVRRVEMGVDLIARRQRLDVERADDAAGQLGMALAQVVDETSPADVEPARDGVGRLGRQHLAQTVGNRVLARQRHHVRRRALQHGDMPSGVGHRRDQRDRGGPTTDHDDIFARVVEVLGPQLRVHDRALEVLPALEVRRVTGRVVVIAGRTEQPVAGDVPLLTVALQCHRPLRSATAEVGLEHLVAEVDSPTEIVVVDDFLEIRQNLVRVSDGVIGSPRLELVAECVQIGVRPDTRVAEQVPGAANGVTAIGDGEGPTRLRGGQIVRQTDPGDAGTDDEHIDVPGQRFRGASLVERGDGHEHSQFRGSNCNVNNVIVFRIAVKAIPAIEESRGRR